MATLVLRGFGQVLSLPRGCRAIDFMTCGTPPQRTCSLTERRSPTSPRSSATVSRRPRRPFYAHWIPRGDKTYIDRLAAARLTDMSDAKLLETSGAGGGSRTRDLLITNQLLCL